MAPKFLRSLSNYERRAPELWHHLWQSLPESGSNAPASFPETDGRFPETVPFARRQRQGPWTDRKYLRPTAVLLLSKAAPLLLFFPLIQKAIFRQFKRALRLQLWPCAGRLIKGCFRIREFFFFIFVIFFSDLHQWVHLSSEHPPIVYDIGVTH